MLLAAHVNPAGHGEHADDAISVVPYVPLSQPVQTVAGCREELLTDLHLALSSDDETSDEQSAPAEALTSSDDDEFVADHQARGGLDIDSNSLALKLVHSRDGLII